MDKLEEQLSNSFKNYDYDPAFSSRILSKIKELEQSKNSFSLFWEEIFSAFKPVALIASMATVILIVLNFQSKSSQLITPEEKDYNYQSIADEITSQIFKDAL